MPNTFSASAVSLIPVVQYQCIFLQICSKMGGENIYHPLEMVGKCPKITRKLGESRVGWKLETFSYRSDKFSQQSEI